MPRDSTPDVFGSRWCKSQQLQAYLNEFMPRLVRRASSHSTLSAPWPALLAKPLPDVCRKFYAKKLRAPTGSRLGHKSDKHEFFIVSVSKNFTVAVRFDQENSNSPDKKTNSILNLIDLFIYKPDWHMFCYYKFTRMLGLVQPKHGDLK